jgi:hypothetical protein
MPTAVAKVSISSANEALPIVTIRADKSQDQFVRIGSTAAKLFRKAPPAHDLDFPDHNIMSLFSVAEILWNSSDILLVGFGLHGKIAVLPLAHHHCMLPFLGAVTRPCPRTLQCHTVRLNNGP